MAKDVTKTDKSGDTPPPTTPNLDVDTPPDMADITQKNIAAQTAMLAAQSSMQLAGMTAQIATAGLNMLGQTVGATTAMAVQTVTDLVKTTKDAVKQQGEAFQKAN